MWHKVSMTYFACLINFAQSFAHFELLRNLYLSDVIVKEITNKITRVADSLHPHHYSEQMAYFPDDDLPCQSTSQIS